MLSWIKKICAIVGASRRAGYLTLLFVVVFLALLALLLIQVRAVYDISLPVGTEEARVPGLGAVSAGDAREVLVLNSYHIGYSWSDNEMAGIVDRLLQARPPITPRIEYLDCKHYPRMKHFDRLRDLFLSKYGSDDFSVVIAVDNPSLEFALRYRPRLFPRASIVFCGINGFMPEMLEGKRDVTGVAELLDADETVRTALALHPKTREIIVVHDYSITGLSTRRETELQLKPFENRVAIRYMPDLSLQDLIAELHKLSPDSLVLALSYSLDKYGQVINHEKIARLLSENAPVPVYGLHEERLGYGIVGGWLVGGRLQGARAADISSQILGGKPASTIPVDFRSPARLMFDYNQLERFHIPLSALPKDAMVVNRPVSFLSAHPGLVFTTTGIIALLGGGIIILLLNIFQRQTAEEEQRKIGAQLVQSQKMEAIGHLSGGIAHDFNNILTAIIGYANLLKRRVIDKTAGSYADQILSASSRAARLTRGLLAFSRKQVIEPRVINVNEMVSGIERIARRVIGEDIECRLVLHPNPLCVFADAGQLDQVIMNLCTNARDAMPEGGRLTIETRQTSVDEAAVSSRLLERSGSYAVITVSDTGIGMDEETRRHIFEPFFTTKEVGKGTGLGLSIAYGIVKQHGGTISVCSEPGNGTTFQVLLPLTAEAERSERPLSYEKPKGGTETILLAEDEAEVRGMIKIVLADAGYRVIEAADGEDALRKFSEHADAVQLVLSDVIMPKRNGKELAQAIRAVRPEIKLLFMSGYTADIVQKKGVLDEGALFISKPVIPDEMLKSVRAVLDSGSLSMQ